MTQTRTSGAALSARSLKYACGHVRISGLEACTADSRLTRVRACARLRLVVLRVHVCVHVCVCMSVCGHARVDVKDLDVLLSDLSAILSRSDLYFRFLRRRIAVRSREREPGGLREVVDGGFFDSPKHNLIHPAPHVPPTQTK